MAMKLENLSLEKKQFFVPALPELAKVLSSGLKKHFVEVDVEVVDCPDLTQEPFTLAGKGLNGNPRLIELGSPAYLIPLVQREKLYDLKDIAKLSEINPAFIIGAGAGPFNYTKTNCEGVLNLKIEDEKVDQQSRISKINEADGTAIQEKLSNSVTETGLLANLFACEGKEGKVLKVRVVKRTGSMDFIRSMREILEAFYGEEKIVGLGGVFLIKKGKAKTHVMPDFSTKPINSDEEVNNWLRFFNMSAPLIAVGTFTTGEYDLDLRVQHFHLFSHHGEAGHYHIDTTPDVVEYEGYFNTGEYIYRIDKPVVTHKIGRD